MAFTPDGHLVTAGVENNRIKLWPSLSSADGILTEPEVTLTVGGSDPGCVYRWVRNLSVYQFSLDSFTGTDSHALLRLKLRLWQWCYNPVARFNLMATKQFMFTTGWRRKCVIYLMLVSTFVCAKTVSSSVSLVHDN